MKELTGRISAIIKRQYRLSLSTKKQEHLLWEDMKKLHADNDWRSGVYEGDKCIETVFTIADKTPGTYTYWISDNELHCMVKILNRYSSDMATEIFVLASHFNNNMRHGTVEVDAVSSIVSYRMKQNTLIPCLYSNEYYHQLMMHYSTSKDIYWAFERLMGERDEPALIFADLLNMRDERQENSENN